jgi:hypothetical protein
LGCGGGGGGEAAVAVTEGEVWCALQRLRSLVDGSGGAGAPAVWRALARPGAGAVLRWLFRLAAWATQVSARGGG